MSCILSTVEDSDSQPDSVPIPSPVPDPRFALLIVCAIACPEGVMTESLRRCVSCGSSGSGGQP
jgi:hypothetical protein